MFCTSFHSLITAPVDLFNSYNQTSLLLTPSVLISTLRFAILSLSVKSLFVNVPCLKWKKNPVFALANPFLSFLYIILKSPLRTGAGSYTDVLFAVVALVTSKSILAPFTVALNGITGIRFLVKFTVYSSVAIPSTSVVLPGLPIF